jgi:phosphate transport system substrate-binding protein
VLAALAASSSIAFAAPPALDDGLVRYEPGAAVEGTVTIAGNHATDDAVRAWAQAFARFQPGVRVVLRDDTHLTTDAFDAALAAGGIDIVPSARELVPSERERMTQRLGGPPLVVAVATGSYATKSGTHAIAFYVNAANPLERISLDQLRQIYLPGGRITKWGDLGLAGEWADKPIHVFSVPISDPNGNPLGIVNYLQERVFHASHGWRRSLYQVDSNGPGLGHHMLTRIVRQVAEDPYAIGFSGFDFASPGAKTLALAESDAGPWYRGTHDEVARRVYPLTRTIYLGTNTREGAELPPPVREFLRFVLSREGQAVFTQGPEKYLPLTATLANAERSRIR